MCWQVAVYHCFVKLSDAHYSKQLVRGRSISRHAPHVIVMMMVMIVKHFTSWGRGNMNEYNILYLNMVVIT